MLEANIRHMFPGGNTPVGFYNYYEYIIDKKTANRVFILKGGPGTGKSTLMKTLGLEMAKRGFDVEFMHCSSDSNSIDGIVIPKLLIAIIDGTTPHAVDPVYPGAVDEILNIGQYWNLEGFSGNKDRIINLNEMKKAFFERAYRYLHSAAIFLEDTEKIYEKALDRGAQSVFIHNLKLSVLGKSGPSKTFGRQRCLFASAITPKGYWDYLDSLCSSFKIIRLSSSSGINSECIMNSIKNDALSKGLFIEAYYCPMNPNRIEHLIIPDKRLAIITANEYHDISGTDSDECTTYYLKELYNEAYLKNFNAQLEYNHECSQNINNKAIESLALAKSYHDELENCYITNMDFEALTRLRESLLDRMLSYA